MAKHAGYLQKVNDQRQLELGKLNPSTGRSTQVWAAALQLHVSPVVQT